MSTPDSSDVETPFKQREEARKLKEQLILETTPGLKRRKLVDVVGTIRNSPNESRQYLQELNSALSSQGTNLRDKLLDAEDGTNSIDDISPGHMSLSQTVFSQIKDPKDVYGRVRQDRDESLVILDDYEPFSDDRFADQQDHELQQDDNLGIHQYDAELTDDMMPVDNIGSPGHLGSPVGGDKHETQVEHSLPYQDDSSLHYVPNSNDDGMDDDGMDSPHDVVERRFDSPDYPDIVVDIPDLQGIEIPDNLWEVLATFLAQIFINIKASSGVEALVADRSKVVEILSSYHEIEPAIAKTLLFEIACKYLPLEECNSLELGLFTAVT
ncbi:centromere-binding protein CNN1 RNJ42_00718 [Nakaseomyces bracarensis]|uniref:centromere-binding protein CNN1 n=1 Tax=Nakaseomyces bracarensis TaxID=273131 RepID=UPI003871BE6F